MKKLIAVIAALMIMVCGCTAAFAEQKTITRDQAVRIALNYAGLKNELFVLTKAQADTDDGRQVWEVEFICDGIQYDINVDMLTGRVIEADRDYNDHDSGRGFDPDDLYGFD